MYSINNVTIYNFLCNKKNRTKRGIKVGGSSPCSNLNFKFNVFQNSNNKSVTNVSTYKLDFVLLLFFFFKLTTKLHKSSGKPDTVCTVNGVHRLRRGRGLDDDIQLGERTWSTRYQQGAVLYTENSTISTARAVGGSVLSSEKEPLGTTNMSPQKTILQWKINGRGDISLKISIKIVQLYAFSHSFDLLAVLSLRMMDGGFLTHFCITGLWSDPHANAHRVCLCTPWIHSQFTIISFPPLL